ncbi:MAG: hypothetical protein ACTHQE_16075, partial [Thermomicrobiales bacterium]
GSGAFAAMRTAVQRRYEPFVVVGFGLGSDEGDAAARDDYPLLVARPAVEGADAAAWLCEGTTCLPPVTTVADLASLLDGVAM